jgi:hypothetical protein
MDKATAGLNLQSDVAALRKVEEELAQQQGIIKGGDVRYGPDIWPFATRQSRVDELLEQQRLLQGRVASAGPAAAAGAPQLPTPGAVAGALAPTAPGARAFRTPQEVQAAYAAGQLTREAALQILQSQFGMQ